MRTCVIFNPAARGDKARRFRRHLDEIAGQCTLKPTQGPGDARRLAAEAVGEGYGIVVAAGGDGTLNEVVNGIVDAPDGLERVLLGVLPLGTINVFARELRIPTAFQGAWDIIREGRELRIDLPRAEFETATGRATRCFAQLAGAGFDARAVEAVDWELKKRIGFFSYVVASLKALREHQPQILARGDTFEASGQLVLLGNGRYYGGPLVAFPRADLADGRFDVGLYPRVTWATVLACTWGLATGRLSRSGGVRHFQTSRLELSSSQPTPLQLDGEAVGGLPATLTMLGAQLRVQAP